jgi:cytochrome c oxidase assembly factor CtaG
VLPPGLALAVHSAALWAWHVPPLYEAAIDNRGIHVLEHLCFLLTSAMFWWSVLHGGRRASAMGGVYVFVLSVESMILGALLTFSSGPWYASHLLTTSAWGLSPLEDQQMAGLIMWVPGGVVYLVSALALFGAWLKEPADTPARVARTPAHR